MLIISSKAGKIHALLYLGEQQDGKVTEVSWQKTTEPGASFSEEVGTASFGLLYIWLLQTSKLLKSKNTA